MIRLSILIASSKNSTEVTRSFTFTDFSMAIINQGEIIKSPPICNEKSDS